MKVQDYGANKVSTQAISNQRTSTPRKANLSIAQGASDLIQGIDEYQTRIDETAAEEALIEFEREKNRMFFNNKDGYFYTKGRNAYESSKPTIEALTKMQNSYADGLTSNRARQSFIRSSNVHVTRGEADIIKHSATGMRAFEEATRKARVENTLESARLYWDNPMEAAIQNEVGREAIIDASKMQGLGAEATNENLETYESEFTKQRIEAAIANNDLSAANSMFAEMGDRVEGQDHDDLKLSLDKANFDTKAAFNADNIIKSDADTLGELMTKVDEMPNKTPNDVALKAEVRRLVTNRNTLNNRIKKEAVEEMYQNHAKNVQDGVYTSRSIPAKQWGTMTFEQRARIKKMEKVNAKGAVIETDQQTYIKLMTLPDKDMANIDPTEYYSVLSKTDYNKLVTQHIKAKKGDIKDPVYMDTKTNAGRSSILTKQVFGEPLSKLEGDDLNKHGVIMRAVQAKMDAEIEANNGKKLSPAKQQEVYDDMAREVVLEDGGWWWWDKTVNLNDYDADDINKATSYLKQKGSFIDATTIIKMIKNNPDKFGN